MVGIGGGAPTAKRDIRLGDVVVSSPENHTGGVYQYDHGRTNQGREFQQTGFLNKPPAVVLTALSVLESTYESEGHNIGDRVNAILDKEPKLRKKYSRPARETDRLYNSTVVHPYDSEGDCGQLCRDQAHVMLLRPKREEDENDASIRYGIIASANQLTKDATIRDTEHYDRLRAACTHRLVSLIIRNSPPVASPIDDPSAPTPTHEIRDLISWMLLVDPSADVNLF
jgi:hypothetical protein